MLAFTLSRTNFRENDQVISFYTREAGKIEPVARGVKKIIAKNAPALEPFSLLDIEVVPGKTHSYVTKAVVIESYKNIRANSDKMLFASFALSLVKNLTKPGERDQNIFKLLHSFEKYLDSTEQFSRLLPVAFAGRQACFLGFTPVFGRCSVCGRTKIKKIFFSPGDGGVICEVCSADKHLVLKPLVPRSLKMLRSVFADSWDKLPRNPTKVELKEISDLVFGYVSYHLNIKVSPLYF